MTSLLYLIFYILSINSCLLLYLVIRDLLLKLLLFNLKFNYLLYYGIFNNISYYIITYSLDIEFR